MRPIYTGVDLFLWAVLRGTEPGVLSHVRQLRKSPDYQGLSATDLSVHLIIDLYDENSSIADNIIRICSNLEMEADQLMHLSKRVKGLGYTSFR